jgi:uncharacterized protein (DUF2062 family)
MIIMSFKKSFKNKIKHHFEEILRTKISPHSIALGFSVGTFLAILPTPGFSILLGFLVILISEKINKYSLLFAMALWNPLVLLPIYGLSYKIGDMIFKDAPQKTFEIIFVDKFVNITRRLLVGNLLIALALAFISYFVVKFIAKKIEENMNVDVNKLS